MFFTFSKAVRALWALAAVRQGGTGSGRSRQHKDELTRSYPLELSSVAIRISSGQQVLIVNTQCHHRMGRETSQIQTLTPLIGRQQWPSGLEQICFLPRCLGT